MADPKWQEIYSQPVQGRMPAVPRVVTPRILRPTCEENCTGRHQVDGVMQCPVCRVPAYNVVLHEWITSEGHYFNVLEPRNGAPALERSNMTPICNCGRPMVREFSR